MDKELDALHLLYSEPTAARWIDEFRAILYGSRESRLHHLGGIQEYLEVLLANSINYPSALSTFHAGLREFVMEWQPAKFQSVEYVELMLDLLAAFTPDPGFAKIVEQLRVWGEFTPIGADPTDIFRLRRRALEVLRLYFPVAPPARGDSWPAFQSYVAILRDNLVNPDQCGLALVRLIDLHTLELGSDDVQMVLLSNPDAMMDLVDYAFQPGNQPRLEWYLGQLYKIVVEAGSGSELSNAFRRGLMSFDATLLDREDASVIALPTGEEISLPPPAALEDFSKYMQSRWVRGEEVFESLESGFESL